MPDTFYYDLYGGSVLFVEGLHRVSNGGSQNMLSLVLGEGIVPDNGDKKKYTTNTLRARSTKNEIFQFIPGWTCATP